MPKSTTLSNANVQAQGDAMVALLSNGYLRIYSGAQPATADTAVPGAQVLLAELRFNTPAAGATPATGIITFTTTLMAAGVGLFRRNGGCCRRRARGSADAGGNCRLRGRGRMNVGSGCLGAEAAGQQHDCQARQERGTHVDLHGSVAGVPRRNANRGGQRRPACSN